MEDQKATQEPQIVEEQKQSEDAVAEADKPSSVDPEDQNVASAEASAEPESSEIVKVDESDAGVAAVASEPEPESKAKVEPKKKSKDPVKLKVVLLEGKDLELEEKVGSQLALLIIRKGVKYFNCCYVDKGSLRGCGGSSSGRKSDFGNRLLFSLLL